MVPSLSTNCGLHPTAIRPAAELLVAVLLRGSGLERATHAVGDAAGLLRALDLHGEPGNDLPPAAADLVHGDDLGSRPDAAAGGHRRWDADLAPAVVDSELEAGRCHQVTAKAVDQRQRQVAVRDRRAEGAFALHPLDIDMDPLIVAGELGEHEAAGYQPRSRPRPINQRREASHGGVGEPDHAALAPQVQAAA